MNNKPFQPDESFDENLWQDQSPKKRSRTEYFLLSKPGKYRLRILPAQISSGTKQPFFKTFTHKGFFNPKFPKSTFSASLACLGRGCPLCREAHKQEGSERTWPSKKATPSYMYYVLNEKNEICILKASTGLHNEIALIAQDAGRSGRNILSRKAGYWIEITRLNKEGSPWRVSVDITPQPLEQSIQEELEGLRPLSEIHKKYSAEELEEFVKYNLSNGLTTELTQSSSKALADSRIRTEQATLPLNTDFEVDADFELPASWKK